MSQATQPVGPSAVAGEHRRWKIEAADKTPPPNTVLKVIVDGVLVRSGAVTPGSEWRSVALAVQGADRGHVLFRIEGDSHQRFLAVSHGREADFPSGDHLYLLTRVAFNGGELEERFRDLGRAPIRKFKTSEFKFTDDVGVPPVENTVISFELSDRVKVVFHFAVSRYLRPRAAPSRGTTRKTR